VSSTAMSTAALTITVLMIVTWVISLVLKNASIVDVAWGIGFVAVAWMVAARVDGNVDRQDAKIAAANTKRVASKAADKAGALAKKAGKHDMVKDAAAGAAIGAVVGIPLPVVGPVAGATIGAIAGVVKNMKSSGNRQGKAPAKKSRS